MPRNVYRSRDPGTCSLLTPEAHSPPLANPIPHDGMVTQPANQKVGESACSHACESASGAFSPLSKPSMRLAGALVSVEADSMFRHGRGRSSRFPPSE